MVDPKCILLTKEKRIKILLDIKQIFDDNNISFFPLYGTLLGFVREGKMIDYDEDADFGAWYSEYDKIIQLKDVFKEAGYTMEGSGMKYRYRHIGIYADDVTVPDGFYPFHAGICFFVKDNNNAVMLDFYDENLLETKIFPIINRIYKRWLLFIHQHNVFPYEWFEKMEMRKVYDMSWSIPVGWLDYVKFTYGDKWDVPDRDFTDKKRKKLNKAKISYRIQNKNVLRMWIDRR